MLMNVGGMSNESLVLIIRAFRAFRKWAKGKRGQVGALLLLTTY